MTEANHEREAPKFKNGLCNPHFRGVPPNLTEPFYYDGCTKCAEKLAKGLTTKDAGPIKPTRSRGRR